MEHVTIMFRLYKSLNAIVFVLMTYIYCITIMI
jgi:hypothetical protein